jgi:DNA-binding SARP family transcriptional activator
MRFRILGSLQVHNAAGWVHIRAGQQRVVLAVLLAEAGQQVSTDRLVDALWADKPPRAATNTVAAYVMRLRRLLEDPDGAVLLTRGRGYQLVSRDDDLDAAVFEQLVAAGRRDVEDGRSQTAATTLAQALALWRGPAFADVAPNPLLTTRTTFLEQVRLTAEEDHVAALLGIGRNTEATETSYRLVEHNPLRERRWTLLMQSLHRCGRRAEALDVFHQASTLLREELGLDPGAQLRELQRCILVEDVTPQPVSAGQLVVATPAQLPADVPGFTGRRAHLTQLDALLGDQHRASPARVCAITGSAGVGKTALAIRWAHRARHHFGDGQLYADLRGYTDDTAPMPALAVLGQFLRAFGHPPEQVPSCPDEASALYRSLVADKRMLIVLDNARDAYQVRPLLPASPSCLTIITSRNRLDELVALDAALPVALPALTEPESQALLAKLLNHGDTSDQRQAIAELASLCCHLPLALRIAAANLITHRHHTIRDYIGQLRHDQLDTLQAGADGVRAAFRVSYATLPDCPQRLFRTLGPIPSHDITPGAAAALAGIDLAAAHHCLDRLAAAHLIHEHAPGRYRLHDLLRRYAAEQATAQDARGEHQAALGRLHTYYQQHAAAAAQRLYPEMLRLPDSAPTHAGFEGDAAALAWLDGERANLVAAIAHAAATADPAAWQLADALRGYFYRHMLTTEWQIAVQASLSAAEKANHPIALAASYLSIGGLCSAREHHHDAIPHYTRAMTCAQRADWPEAKAAALSSLGLTHLMLGQLHTAAGYYTRSLTMRRHLGSLGGQAVDLDNLGLIYYGLGKLNQAAQHQQQAATLYQRIGAHAAHARAQGTLGVTYHAMGRLDQAKELLTQAVSVLRETSDRYNLGYAYAHLATLHHDLGEHTNALELAHAAAHAADNNDQTLKSIIESVLARTDQHSGHHAQAIDRLQRALDLIRQAGDRFHETDTLIHLADAYHRAGNNDRAAEAATQALDLARQGKYRMLEGQALTHLAQTHLATGQPEHASNLAHAAAHIHAKVGHRAGLNRAQAILKQCQTL